MKKWQNKLCVVKAVYISGYMGKACQKTKALKKLNDISSIVRCQ